MSFSEDIRHFFEGEADDSKISFDLFICVGAAVIVAEDTLGATLLVFDKIEKIPSTFAFNDFVFPKRDWGIAGFI